MRNDPSLLPYLFSIFINLSFFISLSFSSPPYSNIYPYIHCTTLYFTALYSTVLHCNVSFPHVLLFLLTLSYLFIHIPPLILTYIHSYSHSTSYFYICTVLHCTVGGGEEEVVRQRTEEESAEHERSHHTPTLRLGEQLILCYATLFHLFIHLSAHSQPSYHFYSFSFYSFTHRLNDRCAILIEFVHNSLPTHSHLHPLPSPPPCRCL